MQSKNNNTYTIYNTNTSNITTDKDTYMQTHIHTNTHTCTDTQHAKNKPYTAPFEKYARNAQKSYKYKLLYYNYYKNSLILVVHVTF